MDALIYTALVYEIGHEVEALRIPVSDGVIHSHRFSPAADGRMYDPNVGYHTFVQRSRDLMAESEWIVVADIADFYPRIYSHPLENALSQLAGKGDQTRVLTKLIAQWNYRVSYGIPVGPAASGLIADFVISDVDQALVSEGLKFCRFNDDYRVFCKDERTAYDALAKLARILFDCHGLTLQQTKTKIMTRDEFRAFNERSGHRAEKEALTEKFEEIIKELGVEWYEPLDYHELSEEDQQRVDALNLVGVLEEQCSSDSGVDIGISQFVLRRLAQLDDPAGIDVILGSILPLYPVFKDAIKYLMQLRTVDDSVKGSVGTQLLNFVESSFVAHLEYHRMWLFGLFASDSGWGNEGRFVSLLNTYSDELSKRELIVALGRARQHQWFSANRRHVQSLRSWERRAFLAGAACMLGDGANHWYRSLIPRLDELEKAVVIWAREKGL